MADWFVPFDTPCKVLGSSAIASHPLNTGSTCGVATNLEVTFGSSGGPGPVLLVCTVLSLGGRLATVMVVATDKKTGRLVGRGTVTKDGKFKGSR